MSSTLKLDSFRTRGGSFSLVGMDVISNKPKRTITRGRTSCVTIAFLSRLEFKNLFMNIALYWCHFNFMPVSSPKNKNVPIHQNVILLFYCLSIRLSICVSICLSIFLSAYQSVSLSGHLPAFVCLSIRVSVCFSLCRWVCLPGGRSVHWSDCPFVCLSLHLSIFPSVRPFVCLSDISVCCLLVCLPVCLSAYLSIRLSICLSVSVCLPVCLSTLLSV